MGSSIPIGCSYALVYPGDRDSTLFSKYIVTRRLRNNGMDGSDNHNDEADHSRMNDKEAG